jgi:hypothetical protein
MKNMRKFMILLVIFLITNATLIRCGSHGGKAACVAGATAYAALVCALPNIFVPGGGVVACVSTAAGGGLIGYGCSVSKKKRSVSNLILPDMKNTCISSFYAKELEQDICITKELEKAYASGSLIADLKKAANETCNFDKSGHQICINKFGYLTCLNGKLIFLFLL